MTLTIAAPRSVPTGTMTPLDLLDLPQEYVAEVKELFPPAPPWLPGRAYELLELNDDLEIWAIHWPRGQGLELHDHGGSAGALWVVHGTLEEHFVRPDGVREHRTLPEGGGAAFDARYVHDVVNVRHEPATSVHACSPPMASMTFYRRSAGGLVVDRTEHRSDPDWAP